MLQVRARDTTDISFAFAVARPECPYVCTYEDVCSVYYKIWGPMRYIYAYTYSIICIYSKDWWMEKHDLKCYCYISGWTMQITLETKNQVQ